MASLVKLLFLFLVFCSAAWVLLVFSARLLALFLSRITGASIMFQVAGCSCLRDFTVKLKKGPLESISIGEIKLSLVKMGFDFISGKPKLYMLISDFEIALRPSEKGSNKKSKKSNPKRSRSTSKGKLMILINMARFLSVTVRELVVKVPKAAIEIKELTFDVDKGTNSGLKVKLHLVPIYVQIYDSRLDMDPRSNFSEGDCLFTGQLHPDVTETNYAPFICEDFWVTCEFGHDMDQGMKIRTLDLACGDLTLNLNEKMFIKTKTKSESFNAADANEKATFDSTEANDSQKDKVSNQSVKKHIFMFPEKVSFNLPKLNVKFMHGGSDLFIENSVVGVYLNCKSQAYEDSGELTSRLDIRTGFREIHLVKEGATSVLEVLKVAIVASIDVPMQPSLPIRIEIDLKLGRTQCNLIISRLKPWLFLHMSKKKNTVLRDEKPKQERSQTSKMKVLMWTCTVSAPELIIVLYSLNDLPLYRGGSHSSHLLANNIASKGIQVHAELGELDLQMADKNQQYLSEKVFGAEINSGSLVHVPRVSLDWGHREVESHEEQDPNRWKLVLSIDITGLGVFICFQHVESLILNMMSFKALLKGISGSGKKATQNKVGHSSKTSSKGTQICKLNLDKCSINYCGDLSVEDMIVADPKRAYFGSQGGQVLISVSADGTPRTASITSSITSDCKKLKFSVSLDIVHLNLCLNKAKHSTKVELERARSIYQEYSEDCRPSDKMTLLDMQKAKFVRRTGGLHEVAVCSLFNATDIAVGWEPDLHLALVECIIRLKALLSKKKNEETDAEIKEGPLNLNDKISDKEATADQVQSEKQNKKRESIFAVDVEMLRVSAELADGVQAMVHVHSIFSENAKIGVLLEGLVLTFDEARVFRSSRMQISRIPISNAKAQSVTTRDWVIQGADVHICMPYRLQLRAIDDAVEDTLRALKLIVSAKTNLIFPAKNDTPKKVKAKSTKFGSVRFIIRKLTADIEEEPLQGWLDEHYKLMKNEACELEVRMKFLENVLSEGSRTAADAEPSDLCSEQKIRHNGVEIDAHDLSAVKSFYEEIHKQSFQSYYLACKKLIPSEGSGAYKSGFQSGFKHSTCRDSVLLLCATELDVTLTKVEGGETGMIQFINRIDPISLDNEIPFSRLYGGDFVLNTGSLVAQIRDYTFPLFAGTSGTCKGRIVLAQQATPFQPQIHQDVSVGRWWTVRLLRSASGTTPPMKFYSELPVFFQKGEVSFGVGYEPVFADISYAFTVALRRAYLGSRPSIAAINDQNQPPKKERSLPWWDDMRNYVHGKIGLSFKETKWNFHGTPDPYEKLDVLQLTSGYMDIQQSDGNVCLFTKDVKVFLSSLESLMKNCTLKPPSHVSRPFLDCPAFSLDVSMNWECESGTPLNHYIFALPKEGKPREKVFDPFRSTALSLRWCFNLGSSLIPGERHAPIVTMGENAALEGSPRTSSQKLENTSIDSPTINLAAHDLAWLVKFWNLMYLPPYKLRAFSRVPRFGVPRIVRSGNLSLDRVMTEFFLRFDCTPTCIKHTPFSNDDPASGLTFRVTKLKLEICFSRGKQLFTFDCKREPLDLVYQGLDLHLLKVYLSKDSTESVVPDKQMINRNAQNMTMDKTVNEKSNVISVSQEKCKDDGFLLHSDYFTIRRQTPKADATKLLSWQEAGRNNNEVSFVKSEYEDGSESEQARSDPSDDDGFNVVVADNCQRIFVYGLKILWTIENRDAVLSFVGGLSKAFKPSKPSPSRQYAQRKLFEEQQALQRSEIPESDALKSSPSTSDSASFSSPQVEISGSLSSPSAKTDCPSSVATVRHGQTGDSEEEGTRNFMVNVIQPQFNLHSEEANGRFLLAAASGRVLARSFHSVLHVGYDMIEKALGTTNVPVAEIKPEMTWKRVELSVMLEHVQAHVAPTDVDPGAGVQWLPKILRSSPKVKRTGALLERVFMPCQMYFRYTRHKGGTPELKVKPLKELTFNSPNITAAMTSRQFQVMMDVLTNLLFARPPKPHTSSLPCASDDDEEEEADEVVPDGIEEVELAKIDLEQEDRKRKLLLDDIRTISVGNDIFDESSISLENNADLWMVSCGKSSLVRRLKKELANTKNSRKEASFSLRIAMQKAAQIRLIEKEKNKSPSYAMRISVKINKVGWSMLADGKSFAEAEINEMIYDFDRDYKDIGGALFTIRSLVVKNCLPNAKSDILLSAWNAPSEWGKKVMLRVNAKQGAPKDGSSPIELFQVEIYPLKIHLTETMYRMMWGYLFPGEEQDTQRRQEAWKVSTTSSSRRQKKGALVPEATSSPNYPAKKNEALGKLSATTVASVTAGTSPHGDSSQASKSQNAKSNNVWSSTPELRRTSSFDRTWEESLAESVADELVLQANSPRVSSSKSGHQNSVNEGTSKNKPKDSKSLKSSRSAQEEKVGKPQDEKRSRPRKMMEFHNIKISQVELLLTYEGSRLGLPISDLRLLMDTFHRDEFTGTWTRLFSRVKKHIIWGVLKSVTGMQGKKFKAKSQSQKEKEALQREGHGVVSPQNDILLSDSDGDQPEKSDQLPVAWPKRPNDGAGDGFVTSIRGLFNNQRRKAKAFVLRTMRGEADNEFHGEWSESDVEFTPFARQLTITKAKKLIQRHKSKYRSRTQKSSGVGLQQQDSNLSSPREMSPFQSDDSSSSSSEETNE